MNKNISSIQYNSLNLPSSINYQNGKESAGRFFDLEVQSGRAERR